MIVAIDYRVIWFTVGESEFEINGYGTMQRKRNVISKLIPGDAKPKHVPISLPEDFRQVSAIIDVDILPETQRRVKLMRNGTDKPLGFYIRDGFTVRVIPNGLENVPAVFISRLVSGGLAESTGLLAVDDEVLEVNGIEVAGKTLDQVTDMMVANSANLIITIKPVNQHGGTVPDQGSAMAAATAIDQRSSDVRDSLVEESSAVESLRDEEEEEDDDVTEFVAAVSDGLVTPESASSDVTTSSISAQ